MTLFCLEHILCNWKMSQLLVMARANIAEIKEAICLAFLKITFIIILHGLCNLNMDICLRNGNKPGKEELLEMSKCFQNSLQWMANL